MKLHGNVRDRRMIKPIAITIALVFCAGTAVACGDLAEKVANAPETTVGTGSTMPHNPLDSPEKSEEQSKKGDLTISDGTYEVPSEIKPGIYKTGNVAKDMCYYARLKDLDDGTNSIIANDLVDGPGIMKVNKADGYIKLNGGCEWTLQSPK